VTAVAVGTTNIIYTVSGSCGTATASQTLTVAGNVTAGTVNGITPLCIGATTQYSSTGTAGGAWSSSNTAVATVGATGIVTAASAGTTSIIYTVTGACNTATAAKTLTVSPNVSAGTVSGITPLCIAKTAQYTSNGNAGGTWSSSNTAVATVNATGVVTGVAAGTTNIIYSVNNGCTTATAQKTLTVSANPVPGTVSGTSPLCVGASAQYTSNGTAGGS